MPDTDWGARVTAARGAQAAATGVLEQTVRDAHAAGTTVTAISAALGIRDRTRVYAILGRDSEAAAVPTLTSCVYVRAAGQSADLWERVAAGVAARGWVMVRSRSSAWHLARGGTPVVMLDLSRAGAWGEDEMRLGRVRARHATDEQISHGADAQDLPLVTGGMAARPYADGRLDVPRVMGMVAEHLS